MSATWSLSHNLCTPSRLQMSKPCVRSQENNSQPDQETKSRLLTVCGLLFGNRTFVQKRNYVRSHGDVLEKNNTKWHSCSFFNHAFVLAFKTSKWFRTGVALPFIKICKTRIERERRGMKVSAVSFSLFLVVGLIGDN